MRILLPAIFLLVTITAFSQLHSGRFVLKGEMIGQDSGYIHLTYFNAEMKYTHDSCRLQNGHFWFTGLINGVTKATVYGNRKSRSVDDPNWMEMFIEPGNLDGRFKVNEFKKATVRGSGSQDQFAVYNKRVDSLDSKWKNVFDALNEAKTRKDSIKIEQIYKEQLPVYRNESREISRSFAREFPSSVISAYLLFNDINLSLDSLKYFYSLLTADVQHSFYGNNIDSSIVKQERLQVGKPAPDFIQADLNGNPVSLKTFKGKYILLDFWASWCIPCREEHPFLKKAYTEYHEKGFVIIGFSMDGPENKNEWLEAIKKDNLPWVQLCDFKVWNSEVISSYNYLGGKGIPANFLIDPTGKIIAKDLRGNDLENVLGKLLK